MISFCWIWNTIQQSIVVELIEDMYLQTPFLCTAKTMDVVKMFENLAVLSE